MALPRFLISALSALSAVHSHSADWPRAPSPWPPQQSDAEVLDESALLSINDLGPLGDSFTRASLSTDGKKIDAHTIREALAFK